MSPPQRPIPFPRPVPQKPKVPKLPPGGIGARFLLNETKDKIVFRWIDGGTLMERWGIDASDLGNLIFNDGLKAWDIQRVQWVHEQVYSVAGYGNSIMGRTEFGRLLLSQLRIKKEL